MKKKNITLWILTLSFVLSSCIMDYNAPYYRVKNCTNDTLLVFLSYYDTLDDDIYWGIHPEDTIFLSQEYLDTAYIHGQKVIIRNDFCALPDSTISGLCDVMTDQCYLYAIKWNIVTNYSYHEILNKKLYDRRVLTKKDFDNNRQYEYRYVDSNQN